MHPFKVPSKANTGLFALASVQSENSLSRLDGPASQNSTAVAMETASPLISRALSEIKTNVPMDRTQTPNVLKGEWNLDTPLKCSPVFTGPRALEFSSPSAGYDNVVAPLFSSVDMLSGIPYRDLQLSHSSLSMQALSSADLPPASNPLVSDGSLPPIGMCSSPVPFGRRKQRTADPIIRRRAASSTRLIETADSFNPCNQLDAFQAPRICSTMPSAGAVDDGDNSPEIKRMRGLSRSFSVSSTNSDGFCGVATNFSSLQCVPEETEPAAFEHTLSLPVLPVSCPKGRRISVETMKGLLEGRFRETVPQFFVFDCRYDYEFKGGYIQHAFNFDTPQKLKAFFDVNKDDPRSKSTAIIFHCEFSKMRGPKMSEYLRQLDRSYNQYPVLSFPEIYILDGGYKQFFEAYPLMCQPSGYISMWDERFKDQCSRSSQLLKTSWEKTKARPRSMSVVTGMDVTKSAVF